VLTMDDPGLVQYERAGMWRKNFKKGQGQATSRNTYGGKGPGLLRKEGG